MKETEHKDRHNTDMGYQFIRTGLRLWFEIHGQDSAIEIPYRALADIFGKYAQGVAEGAIDVEKGVANV